MRLAAIGLVMLVLQNSARYLPQKNVDVNQLTACLRGPIRPRLHFATFSPKNRQSVGVDSITQLELSKNSGWPHQAPVVTVGMYRLAHWTQTWSIAYCVAVFALPMLVLLVPQLGISVGLGFGICCAPVLFFFHPLTLLGVVFSHQGRRAFFREPVNESQNRQTLQQLEQLGGRLLADNGGQVFAAYFNNTRLGDADLVLLAEVPGLTQLMLTGTAVSDAGLAHLHGLEQLKTVDLTETMVSAAGVANLRSALPRATIYHQPTDLTEVRK